MDPLSLGIIAGVGGLAKLGSGLYNANQQRIAARDQRRAAEAGQRQLTSSYDQARGYQQPYADAGKVGLDRMVSGNYDVNVPTATGVPGPYQAQGFNYAQDPGMAYRMQTGMDAINRSAAGRGVGLSGSTLKALNRFGQELGTQEYGNAFNRYMQGRGQDLADYQTNLGQSRDVWGQAKDVYGMGAEQAQRRYGRASDLGQMGFQTAGNMSDLASNYGANMAGLTGARGQAMAQGRIGAANSITRGIEGLADAPGDYMSAMNTSNYLRGLGGGGGGSGGLVGGGVTGGPRLNMPTGGPRFNMPTLGSFGLNNNVGGNGLGLRLY